MADAWTDKKRRSIMNLCVHCKLGTAFLESKEASANAHTSLYIFNYVVECIEKLVLKMLCKWSRTMLPTTWEQRR
uniref:DUF659 domain-containing protein n=1 Tax=Triticum urartu TaxID=4572 RepID=A0A8R7U5M4_TRIUA